MLANQNCIDDGRISDEAFYKSSILLELLNLYAVGVNDTDDSEIN